MSKGEPKVEREWERKGGKLYRGYYMESNDGMDCGVACFPARKYEKGKRGLVYTWLYDNVRGVSGCVRYRVNR